MSSNRNSDEAAAIALFYIIIGIAAAYAIVQLVILLLKILTGIFALIGVIIVICLMVAAAYVAYRLALGQRLSFSRTSKEDRIIARDRYLEWKKQLHATQEPDPEMRDRIVSYFEHLQRRAYEDRSLFDDIVGKLKNVRGLFR
jgi:hypothetical protein